MRTTALIKLKIDQVFLSSRKRNMWTLWGDLMLFLVCLFVFEVQTGLFLLL